MSPETMEHILSTIIADTIVWSPRIGSAMLIFIFFYILSKLVKRIIIKSTQHLSIDEHLILLLARMSRVALIIVGLITAFGTLGIDVSALVAGLGLTGFALGFALKDTISNMLSGVLILLYKPFMVGDRITIAGFEGVIITIDLRYTELETNGNKTLIPNSKLFTDPVTVIKEP